jgi:hypothetical protein
MDQDPSPSNAVFERYSLVLGPGDLKRLNDLVKVAVFQDWEGIPKPLINRSTMIRALIRIAAEVYDGHVYPRNLSDWSLYLHNQLPREFKRIQEEGAKRGPKPGSRQK